MVASPPWTPLVAMTQRDEICTFPTRNGKPCPNKPRAWHPTCGPICNLHLHHLERDQNLTQRISLRLSRKEHLALEFESMLLNRSVSDHIRALVTRRPAVKLPTPLLDVQTYGQLVRIGVNLNQLTRRINLLSNAGETPRELLGSAMQFRREQDELLAILRNLQVQLACRDQEASG